MRRSCVWTTARRNYQLNETRDLQYNLYTNCVCLRSERALLGKIELPRFDDGTNIRSSVRSCAHDTDNFVITCVKIRRIVAHSLSLSLFLSNSTTGGLHMPLDLMKRFLCSFGRSVVHSDYVIFRNDWLSLLTVAPATNPNSSISAVSRRNRRMLTIAAGTCKWTTERNIRRRRKRNKNICMVNVMCWSPGAINRLRYCIWNELVNLAWRTKAKTKEKKSGDWRALHSHTSTKSTLKARLGVIQSLYSIVIYKYASVEHIQHTKLMRTGMSQNYCAPAA